MKRSVAGRSHVEAVWDLIVVPQAGPAKQAPEARERGLLRERSEPL